MRGKSPQESWGTKHRPVSAVSQPLCLLDAKLQLFKYMLRMTKVGMLKRVI